MGYELQPEQRGGILFGICCVKAFLALPFTKGELEGVEST